MVGGDGLTPAVKKEADAALKAHGLIKIRVFSDDRLARDAMLQTLALPGRRARCGQPCSRERPNQSERSRTPGRAKK